MSFDTRQFIWDNNKRKHGKKIGEEHNMLCNIK